jgi:hypothetical protein
VTGPGSTDLPSGAEHLFGELAVRLFMTTRRDLDRALKVQLEAREAGGDPSLGEVMVGLEILTEQQVRAILRAQEIYDDRTVEAFYGKLAVRNDFVSQGDLEAALKIQERTGRRLRIGEILVKKGYISWDQHESLLRAQERILTQLDEKKRSQET